MLRLSHSSIHPCHLLRGYRPRSPAPPYARWLLLLFFFQCTHTHSLSVSLSPSKQLAGSGKPRNLRQVWVEGDVLQLMLHIYFIIIHTEKRKKERAQGSASMPDPGRVETGGSRIPSSPKAVWMWSAGRVIEPGWRVDISLCHLVTSWCRRGCDRTTWRSVRHPITPRDVTAIADFEKREGDRKVLPLGCSCCRKAHTNFLLSAELKVGE